MGGNSLGGVRGGLARADLILALIPLVFVGVASAGSLVLSTPLLAVAGASVACCLLIADGLFWHPPRG